MKYSIYWLAALLPWASIQANEVEVVSTEFSRQGGSWYVSTTLRHQDTGWDHYADQWRVVDEKGSVLGKRILYHPHEHEQPFTRSQGGIEIPAGTKTVFVEAHDKVHGWSKQRVRVDLTRKSGDRFTVN
ncbi:MAG: hypothetical protein LJE56_01165 [Acidiferrobacterales bacterium]|jgi:hypothetical protein|nr:hypothetical protein [Acidiferrobacterales bacterium]